MSTYDFGLEPEHIANPGRVDIKTLQAEGKGPAPCARFCEATAFRIEIAGWKQDQAENLANQCKMVDQITALTAERDALKDDAERYRWMTTQIVSGYLDVLEKALGNLDPEAESVTHEQSFMANTLEHFCHSVKVQSGDEVEVFTGLD